MIKTNLRVPTMLKAIRRTFSFRFRNRVMVCLPNRQMPEALRKRVRPRVLFCMACWVDRIETGKPA